MQHWTYHFVPSIPASLISSNAINTHYFTSGEALMKLHGRTEALADNKVVRDEFGYSQD